MQKGTCKKVRGKSGICVCRGMNGKVKFKRCSGGGLSGSRRRRRHRR